MIIDKLIMIIDKIKELDEYYNKKLDNYYHITDEMKEKAKTNNFMKLKIFLINNRKIIGIILLAIFIFQVIDYFNNKHNIVNKKPLQSGGAAAAAATAATSATSAAKAAPKASAAAKASGDVASKANNAADKSSGSSAKSKLKSGAVATRNAAISTGGRLKRAGFAITDRLKAVAGIYFEILYTLLMAFLICITLGPIIMVIAIFIICFYSFRDQMVAIKKL